MFKNPFSFEGRIRRTEYGFTLIIYAIISVLITLITESNREASFVGLVYIPILWFAWAQGAKRCHDLGNSGWWQLIPFYGLWLLFQEGEFGQNQYGDDPKGSRHYSNNYNPTNTSQQQSTNSVEGYNPGNYSGGHNNHNNIDYSNNQSNSNFNKNNSSGEYNSGELYK